MIPGYTANVSLAPHTTFKVGGLAEHFATATTITELTELLKNAQTSGQPVTILGGGSNILVADTGIPGCVIKVALQGVSFIEDGDTVRVTAAAGESFDELVAQCVKRGYWGLENLSHIPGSVGATPVQNVGAYGVQVSDRITQVTGVHKLTGEVVQLTNEQCDFGYRDSFFKSSDGRNVIITDVTFAVHRTPQPNLGYKDLATRFADSEPDLAAIRSAVIAIRAAKFPDWTTIGTAGSFFKNPVISTDHYAELVATYPELPRYPVSDTTVKVPLGWILDTICQVRGTYAGAVGSYEGQALVLVQTGGATATEVIAFAEMIAEKVYEKTRITVDWEVTKLP